MFQQIVCQVLILLIFIFQKSSSIDSSNDVQHLFKNFLNNIKADYREILKENISASIDNDLSRKFDGFLDNVQQWSSGPVRQVQHRKRHARSVDYRSTDLNNYSKTLIGFEENGTIPVNFPEDICLFKVNEILFAAALHHESNTTDTNIILTIFKNQKNDDFVSIYTHRTESGKNMDCISYGNMAYVAVTNSITNSSYNIKNGSPVFQIKENNIEIVQYFTTPHQDKVYLRNSGRNLYLLQTFINEEITESKCPIYKWTKYHFDLLDEFPCTNAKHIEPFSIGSDVFIAVANSKNSNGNVEHQKFLLSQKIQTHAAVDIKYFHLEGDGLHEYFLAIANSYEKHVNGTINYETQSIIYKYVNDYFTPFQTILLYNVTQFLPVMSPNGGFALLVACENQETKSLQYDGWTFRESSVQFTGGALGKGVSSLRTFLSNNEALVVVANYNMLAESTNIYRPIYSTENQLTSRNDNQWCEETMQKALETNVIDLAEKFQKAPINSKENIIINSPLSFNNVYIKSLVTNSLKIHDNILDQNTAKTLNMAYDLIQRINEKIALIQKKRKNQSKPPVKTTKSKPNIQENIHPDQLQAQKQLEIDELMLPQHLADDNTFIDDELKKLKIPIKSQLSEKYSKNLKVSKSIDTVFVKGNLTAQQINGHPMKNLILKNQDLTLDRLQVNKLILKKSEHYKKSINKPMSNIVQSSHANILQAISSPNTKEISVDKLVVDGYINQMDLSTLDKFALKTSGDQRLDGDFSIEYAKIDGIKNVNLISDQKLTNLVRTDSGAYEIGKDIKFSSPITFDKLHVINRINNINIKDRKFDALLKTSSTVQVITGKKQFENVKLLKPIVLQGKIKSASLEQINPIVSISDELVLEGDYEIAGNVTIKQYLHANNIFGASGTFNIHQLHEEGLEKNANLITQKVNFIQPIRTNNLKSFSINSVNASSFVKTNTDTIQIITGEKVFVNGLTSTRGYFEAASINGIVVDNLDRSVLKKSGDQIITGKIHFKRITAHKCSSLSALLWGHQYSDFFTTTDQVISAPVTVAGNVIVANQTEIKNLETKNNVCGYDLQTIIDDSILASKSENVIIGKKTFTNELTIENVICNGNIFKLGSMKAILNHINKIDETVELTGPITFDKKINVRELQFTNKLNSISSGSFGKQWMLRDGDQIFLEPQKIINLNIDDHFTLNGNINNHDLNYFYENTVWLNEKRTFSSAFFKQLSLQQPITLTGLLSGIKFPNDIIFKESSFRQDIENHIVFKKDVNVSNFINIGNGVNGIDYGKACDLASPINSAYGLIVIGGMSFNVEPQVSILNKFNIDEVYNNAWLNNQLTTITGNVEFLEMHTLAPVTLVGNLNGANLEHLHKNYFSLTKPQVISSVIHFGENVFFQNYVKATTVGLSGYLKCHSQDKNAGIDVVHFSKSVLLRNTNQEITGQWSIYKVIVEDSLSSTLINGLNWNVDMMRYSNPTNNITESKHFYDVNVYNLYCGHGCTVQDVDISEWIAKSTLTTGNYTVQGTTTLQSPVFYNDIRVFGSVNNATFHPENILLKTKDQNIKGDVLINNYLKDKKIVPLSFESVQLKSINAKPFDQFNNNLAYRDATDPTIYSKLIFQEPLNVNDLQSVADFDGININKLTTQLEMNQLAANYSNHLDQLNVVSRSFFDYLRGKPQFLDSYKLVQIIGGNIKQIFCLEIKSKNTLKQVFAIYSQQGNMGIINFYKWNKKNKQLIIDNDLFALHPKDMDIIDITKLRLNDADFLIIETQHQFTGVFKHTFFTYLDGKYRNVFELYNNVTRNLAELPLNGENCFVAYSHVNKNIQIRCSYLTRKGTASFQIAKQLTTPPALQVISMVNSEKNEFILLDTKNKIHVWTYDESLHFVFKQIIKTGHRVRHITVQSFGGANYIAACSEQLKQSGKYGSVDVYKSTHNKYNLIQSLGTDITITAEFSILPTNDFVLYVLTNSITKPLIIFKYTGITNFKSFKVATTLPQGQSISVMKANIINKEFISILVPGQGIVIIGAILK